MSTIGAFAPVKWLDEEGGEETVLFIVGDTPQEIDDNDRIIYERLGDTEDIENVTVVEVTKSNWDIARHGQNIGRGWYITNTQQIEPIKK